MISFKFNFCMIYLMLNSEKNINKKCVLEKNFQKHFYNKSTNSQWNISSDLALYLFRNRRKHLNLNIYWLLQYNNLLELTMEMKPLKKRRTNKRKWARLDCEVGLLLLFNSLTRSFIYIYFYFWTKLVLFIAMCCSVYYVL